MNKIFTLSASLLVASSCFAQTKSTPSSLHNAINHTTHAKKNAFTAAAGDTLFFFDGSSFYGDTPTVDFNIFNFENVDNDGLPINVNISDFFSTTGGYTFYYSVDSLSGDSSFYFGAPSWFDGLTGAAALSDDWFTFGPINVPSTGGELRWQHSMSDNAYRDGYDVMISTTSTDPADFIADGDTVFSVADNAAATDGDTAWTPQSVQLNGYADLPIYIAFHHNAADMFILYLDDVAFVEGNSGASISNVNPLEASMNIYPNPTTGNSTLTYALKENADVQVKIVDFTGKTVMTANQSRQNAGFHSMNLDLSSLPAGVYAYNVIAGNYTATKSVIVK
jgi:hypothetical protein